jgi:hypothetical protein
MNMLQTIEHILSSHIELFVKQMHVKYDVPVEEAMEMWKNITSEKKKNNIMADLETEVDDSMISSKPKKKKKKKSQKNNQKKKLSPWLQFSHDQRAALKLSHPSLTFGEISKKISEEWKKLASDEKKNYSSKILAEKYKEMEDADTDVEADVTDIADEVTTTTNDISSAYVTTPTPTPEENKEADEGGENDDDFSVVIHTSDQLSSMKTKELKEICDRLHLSKTGKKQDLVDRILNCQQSLTASKNKDVPDENDDHSTVMDDDDENNSVWSNDDEDFDT